MDDWMISEFGKQLPTDEMQSEYWKQLQLIEI